MVGIPTGQSLPRAVPCGSASPPVRQPLLFSPKTLKLTRLERSAPWRSAAYFSFFASRLGRRGYLFRPSFGGDWCHVNPPLYILRDSFPSRCEYTVLWSYCGELWRDVRPSTNTFGTYMIVGGRLGHPFQSIFSPTAYYKYEKVPTSE